MKPPKFLLTQTRLKLTLILLMLLFAGYAVKADTPCHVAITSYERQIDSLETRLATAQSLPYNQGYQEGYKQATLQQWKPEQYIEVFFWCAFITVAMAFVSLFIYVLVFAR